MSIARSRKQGGGPLILEDFKPFSLMGRRKRLVKHSFLVGESGREGEFFPPNPKPAQNTGGREKSPARERR